MTEEPRENSRAFDDLCDEIEARPGAAERIAAEVARMNAEISEQVEPAHSDERPLTGDELFAALEERKAELDGGREWPWMQPGAPPVAELGDDGRVRWVRFDADGVMHEVEAPEWAPSAHREQPSDDE